MAADGGTGQAAPDAKPALKQKEQQHQHHRVGSWSWPRLALLFVFLLLDVGGATVLFLLPSPNLNAPFSYKAPGSVTWDLWMLALFRCALIAANAVAFDVYALRRTAQRQRSAPRREQQQQQQQDGAPEAAGPVLVSGAGARGLPSEQERARLLMGDSAKTMTSTPALLNPASASSPSSSAASSTADKKRMPRLRRIETWTRRAVGATSAMSLLLVMGKCLVRLFCGIDRARDALAAFWLAVAWGALCSVLGYFAFKQHVRQLKRFLYWRHHTQSPQAARRRRRGGRASHDPDRDTLRDSLLSEEDKEWEGESKGRRSSRGTGATADVEEADGSLLSGDGDDGGGSAGEEDEEDDEEHDLEELWRSIRGLDPEEERRKKGNATFRDLLTLVRDDVHLITLAFVFLLGAAVGQVMIPHYTVRTACESSAMDGWMDAPDACIRSVSSAMI